VCFCDVQVLANDNPSFGYNAATGVYEDLMAAGIIDPAKVCFESYKYAFCTPDVQALGIIAC